MFLYIFSLFEIQKLGLCLTYNLISLSLQIVMLYRLFLNLKVLVKKKISSLNCWNRDVNFLFYAYA